MKAPVCPCCGGEDVRLVKSPSGLARLVLAVTVGFLLADVIPLTWKCATSGFKFNALSSK